MSIAGIQSVALTALKFSTTGSQGERRAHFDKAAMDELAESIKTHGVLQPIVARKVNGHLEVVAGERRVMAAIVAGLEEIPATVRDLTDEQVLEIQLIENLQREGLHELAEAEGYDQLKKLGHDPDEIAVKVGRSRGYVYGRMKLLALCAEARKAFYSGELNASISLLIARIPEEDQQQRALKHITEKDWAGRTMSYREAQKYIHDTFMLKLSDAPFPREDATLLPAAGACGPCPMRTGNAPADLFGDVKGPDICTNPSCFQAKKAAHIKRELEKARAGGDKVIRGGDARKILPDTRGYYYSGDGTHRQLRRGYARAGDKCLEDPKKRTYAELAGKDAPRVLLQNPDTGRVEKIFEITAIADRLKAKGIKPPKPAESHEEQREQDREAGEREEKKELAARRAVFRAVVQAAPTKLARADLEQLIGHAFQMGYGEDEAVYATFGWKEPKKSVKNGSRGLEDFIVHLGTLSDGELAQAALALTVIDEVLETYQKPEGLEKLAGRLGVDAKKIRAEALSAFTPPAKKESEVKAKPKARAKVKTPAKKK
jgi:ParB/RepB/Spo0J family partition protein